MTYESAKEMYLNSCKASGKTKTTLESYAATLNRFGNWLSAQGITDLQDVRTITIDAFKCERAQQVSATSLNLALTHLRGFFGWCFDMELVERNPFKKSLTVDKSALREQQNKAYTKLIDEKDLILILTNDHPRSMHRSAYARNLALMLVFITTGLRNESVRELRVRDVDFGLMQIHVSAAKGNKSGNAPLTDIAGVALRAYLNGHPELKADDYLFGWRDDVSGEWKPFSREQLSNTVEAAALSYTGKSSIRTHALRHSCASILAKNGLEDREISLLLFHSDGTGAAVTRRYISDDLSWLYQKVNKIFNRLTAKISLVDRAATY